MASYFGDVPDGVLYRIAKHDWRSGDFMGLVMSDMAQELMSSRLLIADLRARVKELEDNREIVIPLENLPGLLGGAEGGGP